MMVLAYGGCCLILVLILLEAGRRAGPLGLWLPALLASVPVFLGLYLLWPQPLECQASNAPFMDLDLNDISVEARIAALAQARDDLSAQMAACGASEGQWRQLGILQQLILGSEQEQQDALLSAL